MTNNKTKKKVTVKDIKDRLVDGIGYITVAESKYMLRVDLGSTGEKGLLNTINGKLDKIISLFDDYEVKTVYQSNGRYDIVLADMETSRLEFIAKAFMLSYSVTFE